MFDVSLAALFLMVGSSQVEAIMTNAVIITTGVAGLIAGIQAARKPKRKPTTKKPSPKKADGRGIHEESVDN